MTESLCGVGEGPSVKRNHHLGSLRGREILLKSLFRSHCFLFSLPLCFILSCAISSTFFHDTTSHDSSWTPLTTHIFLSMRKTPTLGLEDMVPRTPLMKINTARYTASRFPLTLSFKRRLGRNVCTCCFPAALHACLISDPRFIRYSLQDHCLKPRYNRP
jgi:hypothetical protein